MSFGLPASAEGGFEAPSAADFWQPLVGDGAFAITRASIVLLLSAAVISVVLLRVTRRLAVVPSRGQYLTEAVYGMVRNSVARDIIGSRDFLRYVPLLFTLFVLILANNLLGVVPPVQYPTMSRIGFPIALTLVVFALYHVVGIRKHGLVGYFKSFVPKGLPWVIVAFIYPLELITYFFTRPVTLALRLFGNMFAGHILLLLFILGGEYLVFEAGGLMTVAGALAFVMGFVLTLFEMLVEFLQAYVFVLLAAFYIAGALADEH
ncbi:MAG: F0F1 ATP synthase subunit A [Actinomycetales bacterium]|nr:F0F1 ATP synthase subunit A [Actinomycetales bacterium]